MTTANKILSRGWKRGEPWLQEVRVPDEHAVGTDRPHQQAAVVAMGRVGRDRPRRHAAPTTACRRGLVLPMGHKGPAFLSYDNYDIYLEWNQSFIYTLTAAHLAARLAGEPAFEGAIPRGPGRRPMKLLQTQAPGDRATMSARSTEYWAPTRARPCVRSRCASACRSTAGRRRRYWRGWMRGVGE